VPAEPILKAFEGSVGGLVTKTLANSLQAKTLSDLRDILLPRLLSGELRVPADVLNEEAAQMPTRAEEFLTQSAF
jgi:type I restriction enzyme S subunit